MERIIKLLVKNRYRIILVVCFIFFAYLRFFDAGFREIFGYDQTTNSWVMRDMIVNGKRPLIGMVAKGNTGFYIGPAYYYLLVPFYWAHGLDPIAGMTFVGVVSVFTFWVIFYCLFNTLGRIPALFAVILYTFSANCIAYDRIPWPVVFIPMISVAIFYFLYRSINDSKKYLIPLAMVIGFSFHIHFTAVYFVVITILCLPWIIKQKGSIVYIFFAFFIFCLWLLPNIISEFGGGFLSTNRMTGYLGTSFHGIHAVRMIQLLHDALIEYAVVFFDGFRNSFPIVSGMSHYLDVLFTILFGSLFITDVNIEKKQRVILLVLIGLWITVPWVIMATYSGEISNYYFSSTRPIIIGILGYLLYRLYGTDSISKIFVVLFILVFCYIQVMFFLRTSISGVPQFREQVIKTIQAGQKIQFTEGDPKSYLFEYYSTTGLSKTK